MMILLIDIFPSNYLLKMDYVHIFAATLDIRALFDN
jgi:hypothetical protein